MAGQARKPAEINGKIKGRIDSDKVQVRQSSIDT